MWLYSAIFSVNSKITVKPSPKKGTQMSSIKVKCQNFFSTSPFCSVDYFSEEVQPVHPTSLWWGLQSFVTTSVSITQHWLCCHAPKVWKECRINRDQKHFAYLSIMYTTKLSVLNELWQSLYKSNRDHRYSGRLISALLQLSLHWIIVLCVYTLISHWFQNGGNVTVTEEVYLDSLGVAP